MKSNPKIIVLVAILSALSVGCKKSSNSSHPGAEASVDLRVFPNVGFKGKESTKLVITSPGSQKIADALSTVDVELLSVSNDEAKWKLLTTEAEDLTDGSKKNPSMNLSKNRLWFKTVDRIGNELATEGADPARDILTGTKPDHPVKIGENWEGSVRNPSGTSTVSYTLQDVIEVRERKFAVVAYVVKGWMSATGTMWIDLATGVTAKDIVKGRVPAFDGSVNAVQGETWFVDAAGVRWME